MFKQNIALILLTLINNNISIAMMQELALFQGKGKQAVRLPFMYKSINKEKSVFVFEHFYKTWNTNEKLDVIIGMLQPCIGIFLVNTENNLAIAIHKHYTDSTTKIVKTINKELKITDASKVYGLLFTNKMSTYDQKLENCMSYQDAHNGKTQKEEVSFVKNTILKGTNIPKENVDAFIYTSRLKDYELGNYESAELCITSNGTVENNKIEIFSTCPMAEGYFTDVSQIPDLISKVRKANIAYYHALIDTCNEYNLDVQLAAASEYNSRKQIKL